MKKLIFVVFAISFLSVVGCGGGGGGGGAPVVGSNNSTPTSTLKVSESVAAQNFITRQIASPFLDLQNRVSGNLRPSLKSAKILGSSETKVSLGKVRVDFGPDDRVNLFGVTYRYSGGYQDYSFKDIDGNLTENEELIDSLEINSIGLKCSMNDGVDFVDGTLNGKLILKGLFYSASYNLVLQNLTFSGTLNGKDQIVMTSNANVSIDQTSFPYPVNGSFESGTIVFNGHQYNYSASYAGNKFATISLGGAEEVSVTIDLSTGNLAEVYIPQDIPNEDKTLASSFPAIVQSYKNLQKFMEEGTSLSVEQRTINCLKEFSDKFVNAAGSSAKTDMGNVTRERLNRYTINKYVFIPVSHNVIDANTIEVTTYIAVDVSKKPDAVSSVGRIETVLAPNPVITWINEGGSWKITKGLPYLSSELGF
ncbi:MAG TPA: hypothetical protein PLK28_11300 [Candidatus Rifleibacterium sp.]|nr:hypothetical protein [Candidatus Rifleibacterium sp.]